MKACEKIMTPASCWVTHKKLESWARAAKERAIGSTSPTHSKNGSTSTTGSSISLEVFLQIYYNLCLSST